MPFKEFPGQPAGVELLQRSLDRGRLAHPYLFSGHQLGQMERLAPPQTYFSWGMRVGVVDASYATPIQFKSCSSAQLFANQTSAGTLVPGSNKNATAYVNELSNVEGTILLAM